MADKKGQQLKVRPVWIVVMALIGAAVLGGIIYALAGNIRAKSKENDASISLNDVKVDNIGQEVISDNANRVQATVEVCLSDCAVTVGTVFKAVAIVTPADTEQALVWSSNNTGIFEVGQDGIVTVKGAGTAVLTATIGNVSDSVIIEGISQVTDGSSNNLPIYNVAQNEVTGAGNTSNSGNGSASNGSSNGTANGGSTGSGSTGNGSSGGGSVTGNNGGTSGVSGNSGNSGGSSGSGSASNGSLNGTANGGSTDSGSTVNGSSGGGSVTGNNGGTSEVSGNSGNSGGSSGSGSASNGSSNGTANGGSTGSGSTGNESGGGENSSGENMDGKGADSTQIGDYLPDYGFNREMSNVYVYRDGNTYQGEIITQPNVTIIYIMQRNEAFDEKVKEVLARLLPNEYGQVWNNYVTAASDRTFTVEDRTVRIVVAANGGHSQIVIYN